MRLGKNDGTGHVIALNLLGMIWRVFELMKKVSMLRELAFASGG
jgi:hypothetical protein